MLWQILTLPYGSCKLFISCKEPYAFNVVKSAFSSFNLFQGVLTALAVQRYRLGAQDAFSSGYDQDPNAASPYSSFPGSETADPYQQPPFSAEKEAPDYRPPTY